MCTATRSSTTAPSAASCRTTRSQWLSWTRSTSSRSRAQCRCEEHPEAGNAAATTGILPQHKLCAIVWSMHMQFQTTHSTLHNVWLSVQIYGYTRAPKRGSRNICFTASVKLCSKAEAAAISSAIGSDNDGADDALYTKKAG